MASPFPFLELIEKLKKTPHSCRMLPDVGMSIESASDHMYRVAVMCRMAPGFDDKTRAKAEWMALIHSIFQAAVGDRKLFDGLSPGEQHLRRQMALQFLICTAQASSPGFADSVEKHLSEYEEGLTPAAVLVRQLDKLECMDQAFIFEERSGLDSSEFMALKEQITLPELEPWLETRLRDYELLKFRQKVDMRVVFIVGGPGVDEGAQFRRIAKEFDFWYIRIKDLVREEAESPTSPYGNFIAECIRKSVLLPAQLTTMLLKRKLGKIQAGVTRRLLLDGFPQSVDQAVDFQLKICAKNSTICLKCPEKEMRRRLEQRAESTKSLNAKLEMASRWIRTFKENHAPVMEHLSKSGSVYNVDCSGSSDQVYSSVRSIIPDILEKT